MEVDLHAETRGTDYYEAIVTYGGCPEWAIPDPEAVDKAILLLLGQELLPEVEPPRRSIDIDLE